MAGTPYLVSGNSAASGGATTLTGTVATAVADKDTIWVGVLVSVASVTVTVTDSQNNVYTQSLSDTTEVGAQLYVFNCAEAIALSTSDTITVTYSANTSAQAMVAVGDNGVSGPDKMVIAHGSGTAVSTGSSGTLSQAEENAIVFICNGFAGGNPTYAAPWNANVLADQGAGTTAILSAAYQSVAATTALTGTATIVSAPWTAALITDEVNPVALNLPNPLADGVVNEPYAQTLEATGGVGPYTYAIISGSLPPGLSLFAGTIGGPLSWPTASGSYPFTLEIADANSITTTVALTIDVLAAGASGAPALALPNNLLSAADSDFEVAGFTWAADVNAGAPALTGNTSFTGTAALRWIATADGTTSIHTGYYSVKPDKPYICSGMITPPSMRVCCIGVEWYDASNTLISTDCGPDNPSLGQGWESLTATLTSPSNAAKAKVVVEVHSANAGDAFQIDLIYFTQTDAQVLIDWVNKAFAIGGSAGQDFMDVSPFVRMDVGINLTRGRQNAISEIQPGSASFQLQNDTGIFTRFKNNTPATILGGSVSNQRRCQVNMADEAGAWHTRYDGPISQINYTFDNTGNTSIAQVSGTDVLAYLSRQDAMSCWTKEQVLMDGPKWHWTLDDAGNSGGFGVAAETSGNNGPPMRLINSDGTGTAKIAWRDTTGGVETLADAVAPAQSDGAEYWDGTDMPSSQLRGLDSGVVGPYTTPLPGIYLTPKLTAESGYNSFVSNTGWMLQAMLPEAINPNAVGVNYSFEAWFTMDPAMKANIATKYGPYTVFSLGDSRSGLTMTVGMFPAGTPTADHFDLEVWVTSQPPAFAARNFPLSGVPFVGNIAIAYAGDTATLPHHLLVTLEGDPSAPTVTAYLDGQVFSDGSSTLSLPAGSTFDTITAGATYGGMGAHYGGIQLLSVYEYLMSGAQIINHAQMGQYGMWEQPTDDCIAAISNFANIPSFWDNVQGKHDGLTLTEYQSIAGSNPLAAMQLYEQAEMGLLFVDATGALNFHTRDWRMGYGAPDLMLPPDTFDGNMGYEVIDQFQINEQAAATQIFQTGASSVNKASQDEYGVYASNAIGSPIQLPLITWNRAYSQLGLSNYYYWADPYLEDYCAWRVNSRSDPWLVPGQLTVDLLTLDSNTGVKISDFYALEIDKMIAPSGTLPESFPDGTASTEWFIEGISETKTTSSHTMQFYCSPAEAQRAWIPGDSTYGVLGQTTRIGISAPDTSTPQADGKDVSHDAGGPYWPPAFAADMNNPAANGHGFVGANDMRGLANTLETMLKPPLCVVSASGNTQSQTNGALATPQVYWDRVHVDTAGGMGLSSGWPNWYVCTVAGWYEIDFIVPWNTGDFANGYTAQAWIIVAEAAAQGVAANTSGPTTIDKYVCPIGSSVQTPGTGDTITYTTNDGGTLMYLGLGDMVTIGAQQDYTSAVPTSIGNGGPIMSIRFVGYGTADDRIQVNSSLASGGTVTNPATGVTSHVTTYKNLATYSYYGKQGGYKRRNANGNCYQGATPSGTTGAQTSLILMPWQTIQSDLTGATIKSITLECTNLTTWYGTGATMMLGWSKRTKGGGTLQLTSGTDFPRIMQQKFSRYQTQTFSIPVSSFGSALASQLGCFLIGNQSNLALTDQNYDAQWKGGANNWTLTIHYTT